jgi:N6-L-threonylcarbamoyladenine synthase
MYVLGIETSCDETSAAVLSDDLEILSNVVLSQNKIHAPYGGIVPELASRQHIRTIGYVVTESLNRAHLDLQEVDVFAVTQGPGLVGSLLVGLSFAKALAYALKKPLIPVDHLEAHVYAAYIENDNISLPALALLVSGGHTSLFRLESALEYRLVGKTRDDAAGEALDKIAKFLELGYPGGPRIDKLAEKGNPEKFAFALPHMSDGSLDFSFSGFKTAALRYIKQESISQDHPEFFSFLASFEGAIIKALLANVARAIAVYQPSSLILCGGVARNNKLRKSFFDFANKQGLPAFIPSPELCTDNAAMVAAYALHKFRIDGKSHPFLDLNAYPRR